MKSASWRRPLISTILAISGASAYNAAVHSLRADDDCVSCRLLFSRLSGISSSDKRSQYVEMQLRGEPKSGTGFMHDWATNALLVACDYLNSSFGRGSCQTTWTAEEGQSTYSNRSLIFEPRLGEDARCACDEVDRVVISLSKLMKHTFPVEPSCQWYHTNQIALPDAPGVPCWRVGRKPVLNHVDLRGCMLESACDLTDDRLQFVTMRDPRPMALSAFYHRRDTGVVGPKASMEMYVIKLLPHICAWLTIRHILFGELLAKQSTVFWYEDTLANPLDFHRRWLESVGLHLPASVTEAASKSSVAGDMKFEATKMDVHPGGAEPTLGRSWEKEIGLPLFLDAFEDIMRMWLPPELLAKLGVARERSPS